MENQAATIECSNFQCRAANLLSHQFCHQCSTPVVRRYLWAIGIEGRYSVGDLIGERYLLQQSQIVLDTKPGLVPHIPAEIPENLVAYLRLFPLRLHVPAVYGAIGAEPHSGWLLEYRSVLTNGDDLLLPTISQVWQGATALRQLNWLWQIATLWQPLQGEGVASSLLAPALMRANRGIVQLLQLRQDEQTPTLKQLGQLWSRWIDGASTELQPFLQQLCQHLVNETVQPEQLLAILEQGMEQSDRAQRTYQLSTLTETGPSRDHNEDACYPPAGQGIETDTDNETLTIVCDGLGGQEGGEIASQLAVETLVDDLLSSERRSNVVAALERAIFRANNRIEQRNNQEKRHDSQRMGTTLAMAIARSPYLYFSHVGDSRIYLIHESGCHQVMVDDDVASREVMRGYALYQDAVQTLSAGALYQALGIYSSDFLQPLVQRLVLDEDCVLLLCSDGLSDNELLEGYWGEILPILHHQATVEQVGKRLVEIANQQNGHDNVTIALIHCRVKPLKGQPAIKFSLISPSEQSSPVEDLPSSELVDTKRVDSTTLEASPPRQQSSLYWLLLIAVVLGLGAIGCLLFSEPIQERLERLKNHVSQATLLTQAEVW